MMKTPESFVPRVLRTLLPATLVLAITACDQGGEQPVAKASAGSEEVAAAPQGKPDAATDQGASKVRPVGTPMVSTSDSIIDTKRPIPPAPSGLTTAPTKGAKVPGVRSEIVDLGKTIDMTVTPPKLVLGIMQPGVPKTGTVTLTNNGDTPIQIKKAIASCGCTTPVWPREPIGPGESAELEITLKPTTKQGSKLSKRVTLQMVNGAPQVITVEGEVGLFVKMAPNFLDAGKQEASDQQSVALSSANKVPFSIVSIEPPVFSGVGGEKQIDHELAMDWEAWETAGRRPTVKIITDHPDAPELSVTVRRSITRQKPNAPNVGPNVARPAAGRLVNAARSGDLDGVRKAIAAGEPVDQPSIGGMSALHWAAREGNVEVVAALVEGSANPNLPNKAGKTPVALAAESGQLEVLEFLVGKGGDIAHTDEIGGTPLLWAVALSKNPATAEYLVEQGASVNVVDKSGMTPLIWAAGIGQPESVALLVKNGADLDAVEIHAKETALMRAARIGNPASVRILLDADADTEIKNMLGQTAVMIASAQGPLDKLKMLSDSGADLAVTDVRGWTVLDHARARTDPSRTEVIEFLEANVPDEVKDAKPAVGG